MLSEAEIKLYDDFNRYYSKINESKDSMIRWAAAEQCLDYAIMNRDIILRGNLRSLAGALINMLNNSPRFREHLGSNADRYIRLLAST